MIGAPKMRNNFWYTVNLYIFEIVGRAITIEREIKEQSIGIIPKIKEER